ncbi:MAG: hypothetical protein JWP97_2541 [Labilithrix sp.]|nr:hypothetical protein [Labilithrix sp.]
MARFDKSRVPRRGTMVLVRRFPSRFFPALLGCGLATSAAAAGPARADGTLDVMDVEAPGKPAESVAFTDLGRPRAPGPVVLRVAVTGTDVRIPHCNGRGTVTVDGVVKDRGSKGPLVVHLGDDPGAVHDVRFQVVVSAYEKRVACGERVQASAPPTGLTTLKLASGHTGPFAGEAVVFVPRGHDVKKPGALLVGIHPWNGSPWTYAAYRELLEEAQAKDVVLLMPSGLGNSLYTADAEDEVMRAIDAVKGLVLVDPQRVSIWGASMGGQGATTIGFHRPDRFAFVASWFGDARFDRATYVKGLLPTEEAAHRVNPLDVIDNARHVPVFLVHGEEDRTSPVRESVLLDEALRARGYAVDFERVKGMGHEGPLVVRYIRRVVDRAAEAVAPEHPARVTFRSVRPVDVEAYGVRMVRASERDAFMDIERRADGVHVLAAENVAEIVLRPGALGAKEGEPVVRASGLSTPVRWGT